jgi:membrane protease YdiL (CAAX protease family)
MVRVVAGAWAVAEAVRLLAGDVAGPCFIRWLGTLTSGPFTDLITWIFAWCCYALFSLCILFLVPWITARLCYGRLRLAMRYGGARVRDFKQWPAVLAGAGCIIPLLLVYWAAETGLRLAGIPSSWLDLFSRFQPGGGWYDFAFDLTWACIAGPLAEELVFRGFLLETIKNHTGFWPAAVLSSGLFATLHYYSPGGFITVFLFGMAMACVMQRTGKLSICIIAHGLFNLQLTLAEYAS